MRTGFSDHFYSFSIIAAKTRFSAIIRDNGPKNSPSGVEPDSLQDRMCRSEKVTIFCYHRKPFLRPFLPLISGDSLKFPVRSPTQISGGRREFASYGEAVIIGNAKKCPENMGEGPKSGKMGVRSLRKIQFRTGSTKGRKYRLPLTGFNFDPVLALRPKDGKTPRKC